MGKGRGEENDGNGLEKGKIFSIKLSGMDAVRYSCA